MTLASYVNIIASFLNPVQFKARVLDFDRFGRINFYFKKNSKRRCFSKKKQKSTGFLPGFAGSTWRGGRVTSGHDFFFFFINPVRFQSWIGWVPGRPANSSQVSKLCIKV
jgi:hypothetical protein